VARVLRAIERRDEDTERTKERLQALHKALRRDNIVENGGLDRLIREDRITKQMATSLINDSSYALSIARRLLDAALEVQGSEAGDLMAEAMTEFEDHLSGMEARAVSDR